MNTPPALLRLALLASLLLACASALRAEEKPAADPVPPSILKKYDKNKDGALDEKERAKWDAAKAAARDKYQKQRAEMLEKFDTNKDGKLSEEERSSAKLSMERVRTEQEGEKMKERAAKAEMEEREAAAKEAEAAKEKAKEAPTKSALEAVKAKPAEEKAGSGEMMMD